MPRVFVQSQPCRTFSKLPFFFQTSLSHERHTSEEQLGVKVKGTLKKVKSKNATGVKGGLGGAKLGRGGVQVRGGIREWDRPQRDSHGELGRSRLETERLRGERVAGEA